SAELTISSVAPYEVTFKLRNIPTATKEDYFGSIDDIRRYALDPLYKGYIKPHDYLNFLGKDSLSNKLRQVVFDSCGYGIFVECQQTTSDISLPKEIESPAYSVGWMSACQIILVPTSTELGIFIYEKNNQKRFNNLIENITYPKNDIWVISISILENFENGSSAWSDNLLIVELKACAGG
ncbi:7284_t:CDS:2, partial [Funneliformis caledonium]